MEYLIGNYLKNITLLTLDMHTVVQGQIQSKQVELNQKYNMGNGCQAISNLSNKVWILVHMYNQDEQKVPSWAAFHAACGVSEATVTVVGLISITQAHADKNNTVVTILNKFQKMMHHLGPQYFVIVGDQPLYNRTK